MKELSIEQKAQRYDESLEIARQYWNDRAMPIGTNFKLERMFPELKESEDERIRKELIEYIRKTTCVNFIGKCSKKEAEKFISWLERNGENKEINEVSYRIGIKRVLDNPESYGLEKQGEQKSIDEIAKEVNKDKTSAIAFLKASGIINENGELAEQYRQGEQKPAEDRYMEGYLNGTNDALKTLKPAAWSEEDENRINRLIAYFEDKESFTAEDDVVYANWLKSLKDRVLSKKEWSEE